MSSLVINFVPFGSKAPIAKLACKWFLACVSAHMMPEACPLRELALAALYRALVGLSFFDSLRVSRKIRAPVRLCETRLPTSGGLLLEGWNHFLITLTIVITFVRDHNIVGGTAWIRVRMLFVEIVSLLRIVTKRSSSMWCYINILRFACYTYASIAKRMGSKEGGDGNSRKGSRWSFHIFVAMQFIEMLDWGSLICSWGNGGPRLNDLWCMTLEVVRRCASSLLALWWWSFLTVSNMVYKWFRYTRNSSLISYCCLDLNDLRSIRGFLFRHNNLLSCECFTSQDTTRSSCSSYLI